jgi:CubicO group peptidase (beta-lactamase class C family)
MGKAGQKSELNAEEIAKIPVSMQAATDTGAISGSISMVWRAGEVVLFTAHGKRDVEANKPMTRDTVFRIASMTKPITSVVALQLMEEGKLKLDDSIEKWIPELSNMRVLAKPTGALDDTVPAARAITVDDLMTHRSGLAYSFGSFGPIAKAHDDALGDPFGVTLTPDEWLKRLGALPLSFQPGDRFHYSHSTDVLGLLISRIEGAPLIDVYRKRVFGPLGMNNTDFWAHHEWRDRLAGLYTFDANEEKLIRLPEQIYDAPPKFEAGGQGLFSTIDDYLQFARVMVRGGEYDGVRLLKPETWKLMTTNHLTDHQRTLPFLGMGGWWAAQGFGLGVSVITDPDKNMLTLDNAGAFGWPGIYGTWWQADPAKDMILIHWVQNSSMLGGAPAAVAGTGGANKAMAARMAQPNLQRHAYAALKAS